MSASVMLPPADMRERIPPFYQQIGRKYKSRLYLRYMQETKNRVGIESYLHKKFMEYKKGDSDNVAYKYPVLKPYPLMVYPGLNHHGRARYDTPIVRLKDSSMPIRKRYEIDYKVGGKKQLPRLPVKLEPEKIKKLLSHEEDRKTVLNETGFSQNYIMKLQRKVLHATKELQLQEPHIIPFNDRLTLHVLFDAQGKPLFIKKELCEVLGMKGTTFSYWKKKANVGELDTASDFRLMDKCRGIFGGRSTYTLYYANELWLVLDGMFQSRQKHHFKTLDQLRNIVYTYVDK